MCSGEGESAELSGEQAVLHTNFRKRWIRHVAHVKRIVGKTTGRRLLEDLSVDEIIILKCVIRNTVRGCGQDSSGSGCVSVADCSGHLLS